MIEHVERLLDITAVSTEHDVWGDLNVSGTFSHPNQPFRQKPGLLTTLDRCFRLQRRAASVRPAAQTGAVAKWLRQRIANPLSPVRIRAAPFLFSLRSATMVVGKSPALSPVAQHALPWPQDDGGLVMAGESQGNELTCTRHKDYFCPQAESTHFPAEMPCQSQPTLVE